MIVVIWEMYLCISLSPVSTNKNWFIIGFLLFKLKGSLDVTCTFTSCMNWNVCWQCVHKHPIMIKIHPVFFFISFNTFPFLKSCRSQMPVCVTSHRQAPPTIVWVTVAFYPRPALSELSSVHHCFTACLLSDWSVLLLDVINAVIIYSRHLSRWRHGGLLLLCIYLWANHSWAIFTFRSEFKFFFNESSFTMNAAKVSCLSESGSEERGGVRRAHLHLKQRAIKQLALGRAVFDRVKKSGFIQRSQTIQSRFHDRTQLSDTFI